MQIDGDMSREVNKRANKTCCSLDKRRPRGEPYNPVSRVCLGGLVLIEMRGGVVVSAPA